MICVFRCFGSRRRRGRSVAKVVRPTFHGGPISVVSITQKSSISGPNSATCSAGLPHRVTDILVQLKLREFSLANSRKEIFEGRDTDGTRPCASPDEYPSNKNTWAAFTSPTLGPTAGDPSILTDSMRLDLHCAEDPYQGSLQQNHATE